MSINIAQIDQRLAAVETALIQVQQQLGLAPPPAQNWVEQIAGSLADIPEEDYRQFLECCQVVRQGGTSEEPA